MFPSYKLDSIVILAIPLFPPPTEQALKKRKKKKGGDVLSNH